MLFVTQKIAVKMDEETENSVEEERVHVYLPIAAGSRNSGAQSSRKGARSTLLFQVTFLLT